MRAGELGNFDFNLKLQKLIISISSSSFHKMRSCIMHHAERAGKTVCDAKATDIFESYIGSMAGNTLELMCSDYDSESDRCEAIKKMPWDTKKAKTPDSLLRAFGNLLLAEPTR